MYSQTTKLISLLVATTLAASGCTSMLKKSIESDVEQARVGPSQRPGRALTNFSPALRCMDDMFLDFGIERTKILVEDLEDRTSVVKAGTKDMFISAVSDMTRRSHAIELVAYGNDSGNLVAFMNAAGRQTQFQDVPKYDIRGSISQLDKDVVSKELDGGMTIGQNGLGLGASAKGSILGIDLNVLSTDTFAVVPGAVSRNSMAVFATGVGGDVDGVIQKAGLAFSFAMSKSDGQAQALRNLIELGSIELTGRLFKLPYWNCLGIDPDHPEVRNEVSDWYYSLDANQQAVAYVQKQMRLRGYYQGESDGKLSQALSESVLAYRQDLGMPAKGDVDEEFFKTLLNLQLKRKGNATYASTTVNIPPDADLYIAATNAAQLFNPGEKVNLLVTSKTDGFVYCFYEDAEHHVSRIFPNRFQRDGFLKARKELLLPGTMPFQIAAHPQGKPETLTCMRTTKDVLAELPDAIKVLDFVHLKTSGMGEIRAVIAKAAGEKVMENSFTLKSK
ncbi:MAG: DUF4384 domain-containing protein [Pseudomonadota bacterium]